MFGTDFKFVDENAVRLDLDDLGGEIVLLDWGYAGHTVVEAGTITCVGIGPEDDERIVHLVLLQDHLRFLKNEMKKSGNPLPDNMVFRISASEDIAFPLEAYTKSEDFKINLSWDPLIVEPEIPTNFIFTIRDGRTNDPLRSSDYTFVIIQNGKEIHRVSGIAQVGGEFEKFTFSEEQTGPTIIKFENIRNTGQETEFALVVVPEFGSIAQRKTVGSNKY